MNVAERIAALDWAALHEQLDSDGVAVAPTLLTMPECQRLRAMYDDNETEFRSTIDMARYNFGRGQYKYFAYPLPTDIAGLRSAFYPHLANIANAWAAQLGSDDNWPSSHDSLLQRCHQSGQQRPTPLMLRYVTGDYNCLHQDLYGPIHFPLQVVVQLSSPGEDFDGGELIVVEQRPRMQSRPMVVPLPMGAAAIIPVRERPRRGRRGFHRTQLRHGVSRLLSGQRTTLGMIFHDAL